jgi:NADP-dependent 3-hydroxy acid dehydrogenase YdfG
MVMLRRKATGQDFTRAAVDHFGRLDLVVSNAAVSVVKALHEHTSEEWDYVMNSNVKALFWTARHVIPVMQRQKKGLILVSGSISGEVGIPTQGAYRHRKEHAIR